MLLKIVPSLLLAAVTGITIALVNNPDIRKDTNTLLLLLPLFPLLIGWTLYRNIRRQQLLWKSYTLILTNNLITREQLNTPVVSFYFNEVTAIIKHKDGSFLIKGKNATDIIPVPAYIDHYGQLEALLLQIAPFTTKTNSPLLQQYRGLLSLLMLGLMVCVYTATNKILVGISGVLLTALFSWSLFETTRSKNIDAKTRRGSWLILIVIASVIGVTVLKLTGNFNP
jgi:hypothetical protein